MQIIKIKNFPHKNTGIYQIQYEQCDKVYIGQNKRNLDKKILEATHIHYVFEALPKTSLITKYVYRPPESTSIAPAIINTPSDTTHQLILIVNG
jgi:hypothetical protein